MAAKKFLLIPLILFLSALFVFAQSAHHDADQSDEEIDFELLPEKQTRDFWLGAGAETALYSYSSSASFGGSLSVGYGSRTAIGLKTAFFYDPNGVNTLEINFLFRAYLLRSWQDHGPFLEFCGGPALFFSEIKEFSVPSKTGMISAGLGFGWRFHFGRRFYLEPAVRGGYPYLFGGGVSAGIRM